MYDSKIGDPNRPNEADSPVEENIRVADVTQTTSAVIQVNPQMQRVVAKRLESYFTRLKKNRNTTFETKNYIVRTEEKHGGRFEPKFGDKGSLSFTWSQLKNDHNPHWSKEHLYVVADRDMLLRLVKEESNSVLGRQTKIHHRLTLELLRPSIASRSVSKSENSSTVDSAIIHFESEFKLKVFACMTGVFFGNLVQTGDMILEFYAYDQVFSTKPHELHEFIKVDLAAQRSTNSIQELNISEFKHKQTFCIMAEIKKSGCIFSSQPDYNYFSFASLKLSRNNKRLTVV